MTALLIVALVTAVAAAARGMWSPCGLSMLSSLNPVSNADGTVSKRQPVPVSIIAPKPLARMMLYGSRETENSLWNDVLPIVS